MHNADLPAMSGLGSSSSTTVGTIHALMTLNNKTVSKKSLAYRAIEIEQNLLNESVGIQDQIMAAHGGFRILELGQDMSWNVTNMLLPKEYLLALESHVLLGFSGLSRDSEQHAKNKVENIKQGKTNEELKAIASLTLEAFHAFQQQSSFDEIGKLLDKSWHYKQRLAEGVSAQWMDELYQKALANGAFGGKLMGAGGGGFFFFIAPPNKHQQIRDALSQIKVWVPFKIDYSGSQVIFYSGH